MTTETDDAGFDGGEDLDLSTGAPAGQDDDQDLNLGDDAAAPASDDDGAAPAAGAKPKKTAKERIDELTWRAKEAERREQALLDRLSGKTPAPDSQPDPKPAAPAEKAKPDPTDFDEGIYDPAYVEALTDWKVDQRIKQSRDEDAAARTAADQQAKRGERIKAATEKHPDFEQVVVEGAKKGAWDCTPIMAQAMTDSEAETEIAYHLAKNPDEARRIAALSPLSQVREIGRLEDRLAGTTTTTTNPSPKPASDAPPPPGDRARGGGGRFAVDPATSDFAAFERMADSKLGS